MNYLKSIGGSLLNKSDSKFKNKFDPKQRYQKHLSILSNHGKSKITIVIQKAPSSKLSFSKPYLIMAIDKSQGIYELKHLVIKLLSLSPNQSYYLFIKGILPMNNEKMGNLEKYCEHDGFLYFFFGEFQFFG